MAPRGNGRADARSGAQSVERELAVLRCFERADRNLAAVAVQGPAMRLPDDLLASVADATKATSRTVGPLLAR